MNKALTILILLATLTFVSCYDEPPSDGELTRKLYEKYHDKAIGQWYVMQDSLPCIYEENNQAYFLNLEQYYNLKADGSMDGRLRIKAWRIDGSPTASGDECFEGDYTLSGDWSLVHKGYDYLQLKVNPVSDNPDDIRMVESIYTTTLLDLEYITDDEMRIRSPLVFTHYILEMQRVNGRPDDATMP